MFGKKHKSLELPDLPEFKKEKEETTASEPKNREVQRSEKQDISKAEKDEIIEEDIPKPKNPEKVPILSLKPPKERKETNKKKDKRLKKASQEKPKKRLVLKTGGKIKSMDELKESLKFMDKNTYKHHVKKKKNDFANWVEKQLKDKELARKMKNAIGKEHMLNQIEIHEQEKKYLHDIRLLKDEVKKRDKIISETVGRLEKNNERINELPKNNEEDEKTLKKVGDIRKILAEKDIQISGLKKKLADKEKEIAGVSKNYEKRVREKEKELMERESQVLKKREMILKQDQEELEKKKKEIEMLKIREKKIDEKQKKFIEMEKELYELREKTEMIEKKRKLLEKEAELYLKKEEKLAEKDDFIENLIQENKKLKESLLEKEKFLVEKENELEEREKKLEVPSDDRRYENTDLREGLLKNAEKLIEKEKVQDSVKIKPKSKGRVNKDDVSFMIKEMDDYILSRDIEGAKALLSRIKKSYDKLKKEEKEFLKYELIELETNIRLASI